MNPGTRSPVLGYHGAEPSSEQAPLTPDPRASTTSQGAGWLQVAATVCTGGVLLASVLLLIHADRVPSGSHRTRKSDSAAAVTIPSRYGTGPASSPPAGISGRPATTVIHTPRVVYLVRTDDEAVAVDAELNRAAEQRAALHTGRSSIELVVVAGTADIEDGVRAHFDVAGIEVDVVDLRGG